MKRRPFVTYARKGKGCPYLPVPALDALWVRAYGTLGSWKVTRYGI